MKNKVYLVQANVAYSDYLAYLPYAAGCLAAYVFSQEEINEQYELGKILFLRQKIEQALQEIENPFLVGFSCYIWNMEYNKALARAVKEKYPNCVIVFGGHNIPFAPDLLKELPYVDFLMHGEGEHTLKDLLTALQNGAVFEVKGISYRNENGECMINPQGDTCFSLEDLPSPYLTGYFDEMTRNYPEIEFQGTLETNRGCPYTCAFCDWCFTEKIRYFPMEKIKGEIAWMSAHKIKYCYCADSNFGIAQRDLEIAREVVDYHNRTGFPGIFKPCYAKNSNDLVFQIGCLLNSNGVDKGVTLAYQSMNADVLENIGRKNLDIAYYTDLNARYSEMGIPTYTELILGLPGETYESFCHGLCDLLEAGQHNSMTVYTCQVYCNSPLAQKEYSERFGIKWEKQKLHGIHYPADFNGVQEYYDVVVETNSMCKADWVRANMFSVTLQSMHHLGLLRCIALYLRHEKNISYYDFYNRFLDYIFSDDSRYIYRLFADIRQKTQDTVHSDWCYQNDVFSKVGWYFEEGIFLDLAYRIDTFFEEIKPFVSSFDILPDVCEDLFHYQKQIIRLPGQNEVNIQSRYDFYTYFENVYEDKYAPLQKISTQLYIVPEKKIDRWDIYAKEIIWYGKRRSATLLTNPREHITVSHKEERV